jgi:hypothetical protein
LIAAIIRAADALLHLLESPRNKRDRALVPLKADLRRILTARWKLQAAHIRQDGELPLTRFLSTRQESAGDQARRMRLLHAAESALLASWLLRGTASAEEIAEWDGAIEEAISVGASQLAAELGITDTKISDSFVTKYMREHGFEKLASALDETTLDRLKSAAVDTYEAGGTYEDIVDAIAGVFDGFSAARLDTIAATELNGAWNHGRMEEARLNGAAMKVWDAAGEACPEVCEPNAVQGAIPIDAEFDSGDDAPPAHPNCDCILTFEAGDGEPVD